MISTVERLSPCEVAIHFEADTETYEKAVEATFLKQRTRIRVPGFRPGKAPRKIIEKMYGETVFAEGAIDEIFQGAFSDAVTEHKLQVIDRPDIKIEKVGGGQPAQFTAEVTVYPTGIIGDYKTISVARPKDTVDDDAVDQEIQSVRERNARMSIVENRAAQDDDIVRIDYKGSIDGELFEGGTATDDELTIGSGKFVPGFEEQIVGMNIGDVKTINVTFPADYHAEDLKGKDAQFEVKLNGITTRELPELDDEFAKDVSEFDTLEEYRASVRAELEKDAKERAEIEWDNEILEQLEGMLETKIPDIMIEEQVDIDIRSYVSRVFQNSGRISQDFFNKYRDEPSIRENFRPNAEKHIRYSLALDAVVDHANIEYNEETDGELFDKTLAEYAEKVGRTIDETREQVAKNESLKASFASTIAKRKAVIMLREFAEANATREMFEKVEE